VKPDPWGIEAKRREYAALFGPKNNSPKRGNPALYGRFNPRLSRRSVSRSVSPNIRHPESEKG
jgi:hypothetical protein